MRSLRFGLAVTAIVVLGLGLTSLAGPARRGTQTGAQPAPHGLNLADLDRTCKPCDDFYKFADGGWMAKNPIP